MWGDRLVRSQIQGDIKQGREEGKKKGWRIDRKEGKEEVKEGRYKGRRGRR